MTNLTELEKLRPCGRLETFSTTRHHLGLYKNVGLTAEYAMSDTPQVPLELLVCTALRHAIAEHPNLSAIALNEDKSFPNVYFARLPEVDLRTCIDIRQRCSPCPNDGEADEEMDDLLAREHSRDFKQDLGSRPFWRLIILTSPKDATKFTATWIWHHALADGASAFLFHESFLAGLNSSKAGVDTGHIVKSPASALLPPLEELHPMPVSWSFFLQAILGSILPSLFAKRPGKLWTGNPVPQDTPALPKPQYRTLVLSKKTTSKVAQVSRKQKASVTSTLQCLLASSLFDNLPATEFAKIKIEGPISMRRFLDVNETQMTNAIAQYGYLHERRSSVTPEKAHALQHFSWDTVRAVKFIIQSEVAKEGRDSPITLLKYVSDMPKFFLEKLGKPRNPTAELSNVGIWQSNRDEGNWKVGRMVFSQCPNIVGSAFAVSVVTGGDGNAVLNFGWMEGAVEKGLMEKIVTGVREGVEALVNNDDKH